MKSIFSKCQGLYDWKPFINYRSGLLISHFSLQVSTFHWLLLSLVAFHYIAIHLVLQFPCRQIKTTSLVIMIWRPCTTLDSTFYCGNTEIRTQCFDSMSLFLLCPKSIDQTLKLTLKFMTISTIKIDSFFNSSDPGVW